jgi:3-oxoacyl-[acyl-carrier-protein] synthase-3
MDEPEIHLRSVATALPGPAVDNATLTRRFNMPGAWREWIDAFVGIRQRHFAVDLETGEVRYSLADLAATAGARALAAAGVEPAEVDLVVLATSSPDLLMPATVNVVADRLGIDGVRTYQLQSGCTGAVQALDVAAQMLRGRRARTALVLGGDTCAKHLDLTVDPSTLPPATQVNGVLFGDGAGAAVLTGVAGDAAPGDAAPGEGASGADGGVAIRYTGVRLVGHNRPPGQVVEWYGWADRGSDRPPVVEDYKAIEESVPVLAAEMLDELLADVAWKDTELDYLLPPQLSGRMTARIVERLGAGAAQEVSCVAELGNTGNALPFFQLELVLPRMVVGDRAVGIAVESSKWIKAGFALEKV